MYIPKQKKEWYAFKMYILYFTRNVLPRKLRHTPFQWNPPGESYTATTKQNDKNKY